MHPRRKQTLIPREAAQQASTLTVSAAEFCARASQVGWDEDRITLQLETSRILGSAVLVGDALLRVIEPEED